MLVRWLPPGSALHRAQDPEGWQWDLQAHLAASTVDRLAGANWQRGGGKGQRPKPWPRPGVGAQTETFRGKPIPLEEMKRRFEARKAQWMAEAEDVS